MSCSIKPFVHSAVTQKQPKLVSLKRDLPTKEPHGFYTLTAYLCSSPETSSPVLSLSVHPPVWCIWSLCTLLSKGVAVHGLLSWTPTKAPPAPQCASPPAASCLHRCAPQLKCELMGCSMTCAPFSWALSEGFEMVWVMSFCTAFCTLSVLRMMTFSFP